MGGLGPALVAGGFTGSTDCRRDRLSLRYVGQVHKFGRTYRIYANRYRLKPPCRECAVHGGQRIIFMERGRYIGQYRGDSTKAVVRNGDLIFSNDYGSGKKHVTVSFTAKGPARDQWDGSEVLGFYH